MIKRQKYNYFVYKYMFLIENLTVEGGSKAKFNILHEYYIYNINPRRAHTDVTTLLLKYNIKD